MKTPPPHSPTAKQWLRRLVAVRNAAVNLANTAEPWGGLSELATPAVPGSTLTVAQVEFRRMIRAINRLMDFEDSLQQ
jgi:hypothetical protein